jgi:hypothetical protein
MMTRQLLLKKLARSEVDEAVGTVDSQIFALPAVNTDKFSGSNLDMSELLLPSRLRSTADEMKPSLSSYPTSGMMLITFTLKGSNTIGLISQ